MYRNIAPHTFTDRRYIQKNKLFVHVREGKKWKTATCTAHPNTILSIYLHIAPQQLPTVVTYRTKSWFSISDRSTSEPLLHALPIQTTIYQSTVINQPTQLPTIGTYRTKSWFSTSDRATTEQLLHTQPIEIQLYQSNDISQRTQLPTVGT